MKIFIYIQISSFSINQQGLKHTQNKFKLCFSCMINNASGKFKSQSKYNRCLFSKTLCFNFCIRIFVEPIVSNQSILDMTHALLLQSTSISHAGLESVTSLLLAMEGVHPIIYYWYKFIFLLYVPITHKITVK